MSDSSRTAQAVASLKGVLHLLETNDDVKAISASREEVLARYQPVFEHDAIPHLSEAEFRAFLRFENNKHWGGLARQAPSMCADMDVLRPALQTLVDERIEVAERLNTAIDAVKGLGRALATAILLITQPDRYGVWNSTSEAGLKKFDLWPDFPHGATLGEKYVNVNEILLQLAKGLDLDLWTLDSLWWGIANQDDWQPPTSVDDGEDDLVFGLERHLHDFLRDNWKRTSLAKEYSLYSEIGNEEAGYEYPCGVGYIDLLAKHNSKPEWLVIELKRNQSSDQTVGQVLRYMGWIRKELAQKGDEVRGLIIAHSSDDKLKYALTETPNVDLMHYEVDFRLKMAGELQ